MTTLKTKTARELSKLLKEKSQVITKMEEFRTQLEIDQIISFKDELKEIDNGIENGFIGDTLFRHKIQNFIKEIEHIEQSSGLPIKFGRVEKQ